MSDELRPREELGEIIKAVASFRLGTGTNDNAAAGYVGELIEANVLSGDAVALTTNVVKTVTSISLTAGDWDVEGVGAFTGNVATTLSYARAGISSTDNVNAFDGFTGNTQLPFNSVAVFAVASPVMPTGVIRKSLSATTSIYLVAQAGFGVNTCSAYGHIRARRVR